MSKREKKLNKAMQDKENNINGFFNTCEAVYGNFTTKTGEMKRGWFLFRHSNANYEFIGYNFQSAYEFIIDYKINYGF